MAIHHTAHLECDPAAISSFRIRLHRHASQSLAAEPGCLRFDIYESTEQAGLFLLMEEYADEQALATHQASAHVASFRRDTADWVVRRTWWFWSVSQVQSKPATAGA